VTATQAPPATPGPLLRTPLFPVHTAHHAHLVPFAGWEMPLYYDSILAEHAAVRTGVGLFDVGHMGILTARGAHAAALLARRTTANVASLASGQCKYTFLLEEPGDIFDDLLITRLDPGGDTEPTYLVVPNAANAAAVFDLLRSHRLPDTTVARHNGAVTILAVQGPRSRSLLESQFGWDLSGLRFYTARVFPSAGSASHPDAGHLGVRFPADLDHAIVVSRTGYTGELGYEMFVRGADAPALAERLVAAGATLCGLGARDTLRLEKGYLLSGQDFHHDRTPLEAGQEKFVEFDHPFVGREALEKQRAGGPPERLTGLVVEDAGAIPRHGTVVLHEGKPVGTVTSGGLSPSLHVGIALAYLPTPLATPTASGSLALEIRGRPVAARIQPPPFYPPAGSRR
jgi:aminomethyltransferase